MKKKFLFVIVLLSFFIPVKTLGLSGDISFSCNSTTVNVGDEVRCKIVGYSDGAVSEIFSNLTSDGNIIVTNFKAERIWKINSEWPNLSLTSSDKYPGNFELGTVYLKAVASGVGTFYMNGITFTSDNGEVAVIPNKSVAITVIGNTPAPTPTPDPTPVEPVKSSDATLKSLIVNDIDINFNPSINEYNVEVSSNVSSVKIDAVANDNKATIKLPTNLSLVTGANQFLIEVVAEDGTVLSYKVNVTRLEKLLSDNALLSNIKIDGYNLNFSSDVFEYNIGTIKNNYLDIRAITEDSSATVVITGNSNIGKDDSIIIKVTSEAGSVKKYIIYASYVGEASEVKSNDLLLTIVSGLFVFSSFLVLVLVINRKRKNKKNVNSTVAGRAAIDATLMKNSKKGATVPLQLKIIEAVKQEEYEVKKAKEEKIKADKKKIKEAMEKIKREKAEQKRFEKERLKREREERKKEEKEKALREREEGEKARLLNEEKQKQEREQALKEKEERERQRRELEEKIKAEKLAKIEQEKAEKERLRLEKEAKLKEEKEREEKIKVEKEKQRLEKIQKDKERKELEAKAREEQERQKKLAEEQAKAEKERQRREKEEQEKAAKEKEQKEKIDLIKKQQELEQASKVDTANTGDKISSEDVLETVKVTPKEEVVTDNNNANTSDAKLDVSKEKTHTTVVTEKKQVEIDAKNIGAPEVSQVVNTVAATPVVVEEEPEVLDMNVTVISPEQVLSAVKVGVKKEEPKVDNKSKRKKGKR